MADLAAIKQLLDSLTEAERQELLGYLRQSVPVHPVEETLMASAETILEAIARSPDLTVRGIEGIIAEAAFASEVIPSLVGWAEHRVPAGLPYDFILDDGQGPVRIQVKMQRRKDRKPLRASDVRKSRNWPAEYFIVETQRTRAGRDKAGVATRPYRFGDFDILAVSMGASQRRWSAFRYTVQRWLWPSDADSSRLDIYQPVPPAPNDDWTDDFLTCVGWLRGGRDRRIGT